MAKKYTTPPNPSSPIWRVSADCPTCGKPLQLRSNRIDGSSFIGCSAFPRCRFAEPIDEALSALTGRINDLEDELAVARSVYPSLPAETFAKELRALIAYTHPDRHPGSQLAHEICSRLTDLRARVTS